MSPCTDKNGLEIYFYNGTISIGKDKKVFAMGRLEHDHELYKCPVSTMYDMWHCRLGHPVINKMEQIIKKMFSKMDDNKSPCKHYIKEKTNKSLLKKDKKLQNS